MNTITSERYALVDGVPTVETVVYMMADDPATELVEGEDINSGLMPDGSLDPRYRSLRGYEGRWIWVTAYNSFADIPEDAEGVDRYGLEGTGYFGIPVRPNVQIVDQDTFVKLVEAEAVTRQRMHDLAVEEATAGLRTEWDAKAEAWKKVGVDPALMIGARP